MHRSNRKSRRTQAKRVSRTEAIQLVLFHRTRAKICVHCRHIKEWTGWSADCWISRKRGPCRRSQLRPFSLFYSCRLILFSRILGERKSVSVLVIKFLRPCNTADFYCTDAPTYEVDGALNTGFNPIRAWRLGRSKSNTSVNDA